MARRTALAVLALATVSSAQTFGFPYGQEKVRGVNLGGWLVLEPWITPSLFEATGNDAIVDEWTFGQLQDRGVATAALQQHWSTWITQDDFRQIAAAGLNHVRLPIGYWAWDVSEGEPFIQGQLPFLEQAVQWAAQFGIKVIIDLHGVPGSQNGFDNSGRRQAQPQWQTSQDNVNRANNIIKILANQFSSQSNVVTAIAPLNEPAGFFDQQVLDVVTQYWFDSYGNIRFPFGSQPQNLVEVIHDAFQPLSFWNGILTPPNFQGVAIDTHIYQVFSDELVAMSWPQHLATACSRTDLANFDLWTIVGEWTLAAYDCALWLNGRGVGARYDGTFPGSPKVGDCQFFTGDLIDDTGLNDAQLNQQYRTFLRQFYEAQTSTYELGAGWIFWAWKVENADEWSYQRGLQGGWIPQNPTDRMFPNVCSTLGQ